MPRLYLTLFVFLFFLPAGRASLEAPVDHGRLVKTTVQEIAMVADLKLVPTSRAKSVQPELVLTDRTEIRLDGKTCRLDELPASVEMYLLEVAQDHRTVLKVHFRRK